MPRIWKIVRHGSAEPWEKIIPEDQVATRDLVMLLSNLAMSHCPPSPTIPAIRDYSPYTTSLTNRNDRFGNVSYTMYSSCSRIHYIATLENPSNADGPNGQRRPRRKAP
jgi:hypothetical protein